MSTPDRKSVPAPAPIPTPDFAAATANPDTPAAPPRELGGPKGPEPTRFGDWEKNGRCIDF
jgi:hypothetical protein